MFKPKDGEELEVEGKEVLVAGTEDLGSVPDESQEKMVSTRSSW